MCPLQWKYGVLNRLDHQASWIFSVFSTHGSQWVGSCGYWALVNIPEYWSPTTPLPRAPLPLWVTLSRALSPGKGKPVGSCGENVPDRNSGTKEPLGKYLSSPHALSKRWLRDLFQSVEARMKGRDRQDQMDDIVTSSSCPAPCHLHSVSLHPEEGQELERDPGAEKGPGPPRLAFHVCSDSWSGHSVGTTQVNRSWMWAGRGGHVPSLGTSWGPAQPNWTAWGPPIGPHPILRPHQGSGLLSHGSSIHTPSSAKHPTTCHLPWGTVKGRVQNVCRMQRRVVGLELSEPCES